MIYAKIDLSKTNYQMISTARVISRVNIPQLNGIYTTYCRYKKFTSVMPIFDNEYLDSFNDVIGYHDPDDDRLIAFSLIRRYDARNAEAIQFAWDYEKPDLELGLRSLKHECAYYKREGYQYLYLGSAEEYKRKIDGFEILGPA
jgi:hypothetical protein